MPNRAKVQPARAGSEKAKENRCLEVVASLPSGALRGQPGVIKLGVIKSGL
jgi:hypothetical protein